MENLLAAAVLPHVLLRDVGRMIPAMHEHVTPGLLTRWLGQVPLVPFRRGLAGGIYGDHHSPVAIAPMLDELADFVFVFFGQVTLSLNQLEAPMP